MARARPRLVALLLCTIFVVPFLGAVVVLFFGDAAAWCRGCVALGILVPALAGLAARQTQTATLACVPESTPSTARSMVVGQFLVADGRL